MGCDIHLIVCKYDQGEVSEIRKGKIEVADYSHEDWLNHRRPWSLALGRNYERFAKLSGVRGQGPDPNDWPEWAQHMFADDYHDGDLHSHTCLPLKKAAKIFADTEYTGQDSPIVGFAKANPVSMYFNVDLERPDLDKFLLLICYDN